MKLKTKIKLTLVGVAGTMIAGVAINKKLKSLVREHLSNEGIKRHKNKVMSSQNQDEFANSPENIKGQLFYVSTPQINISIPNSEGRHINALLFKQEGDSERYAVLVHGYRSSVKGMSYLARRYYEAGYNVLIPYLRAHHGSDYEYSTMGWHERFDIIDWIKYIERTTKDAKVVLHGVSMGAATVMMTTGETLPPCVICAIEDCGYTSVFDAYSYKIPKMMNIPAFPSVDIFRIAIKKHVGFDIREASALEQVRKSHTPTLFIHGESDTVVPVSMAYELYSNASCEKDIAVFKRADHAMSPLLYPEQYWDKVMTFIAKYE